MSDDPAVPSHEGGSSSGGGGGGDGAISGISAEPDHVGEDVNVSVGIIVEHDSVIKSSDALLRTKFLGLLVKVEIRCGVPCRISQRCRVAEQRATTALRDGKRDGR
jgi:hypothetical protein